MDAPPLPPPPGQTPPTPGWGPPAQATPAFKYAGFWQRFAALFIDGLVLLPLEIPFFIGFWNAASSRFDAVAGRDSFDFSSMPVERFFGWAIGLAIVHYAYQVVMVGKWNATVGKFALSIRVRRADGSPATWREALLRPVLQLAVNGLNGFGGVGILGLLDYLWMLWDRQKQTLHDKIAGTTVVQV
jgi:uncharacterized RDD family membrane protein YckC